VPSGVSVMFDVNLTGSRPTPATFNALMTCDGAVTIAAASAAGVAWYPMWVRAHQHHASGCVHRRVEQVIRDDPPAAKYDARSDLTQWPKRIRRHPCRSMRYLIA
jgi:hypothetical protein